MTDSIEMCYVLRRQDDEILMGRKGYWFLSKQDGLNMCLQFIGTDGFEGVQILVKEFAILQESIAEHDRTTDKTKTYDRMKFIVITETGTKFEGVLANQAAFKITP